MVQRKKGNSGYLVAAILFLCASNAVFAQVPVITSFAPRSGPIGTMVIITGSNFGTTTTSNTVFFGPVKAIVSAASSTSLTVNVPIGATYNPITVTVNLLTASSDIAFTVTKPVNQNISAASLTPHTDVAMNASPQRFSLGDFDNSGQTDIALVTSSASFDNYSFFRNTSDCKNLAFANEQKIYSGSNQVKGGMESADLDGDGKLDVVVSETAANFVTVHPNASNPGAVNFNNQIPLGSTSLPTADLKIADMDGDGRPDIVVGLFNSLAPTGGLAIYRNTSSGVGSFTFALPEKLTFLANPKNIELADADGDGKTDIIITDGVSSVRIRRNKSVVGALSDISFEAEVLFTTSTDPQDLRAGDIDGDGKLDIVVGCGTSLSILDNTGTPGSITATSFSTAVNFPGVSATTIDLGDLNGDGKIDVAANNGTNISVFQNQSTAGPITASSLGSKFDFSIGTANINELRMADMNGDGYLDIVAAQTGNFFSVFLYNPPVQPPPAITAVAPTSALVNSTVNITGSNFGTSIAANRVYFGPVKATITSATATQLVVTIPAYAASSPITVENITENLSVSSLAPFTPLFDNNKDYGGRIIPASFAARTDMKIGSTNAESVSFGDIDGDGFADLLVSGGGNDSLLIFRSKGNNLIGNAGYEKIGLYYDTDGDHTVLARDIDGDGKLDLVMLVRGGGDTDAIFIYHNESTPGSLSPSSFASVFKISLGFLHINNSEMNIADMDGDGKPDIITDNSGVISVFKNNSLPASFCFAPSVDIPGVGQVISVGDIDGDGKPDLAIAGGYYGTVGFKLVRNTSAVGLLSFGSPVTFATASGNFSDVEIGDVDGDNKPDVVWVSPYVAGIGLHVMKNTATTGSIDASSLAAEVDYFLNTGYTGPTSHTKIADVNGDGKPDVISCQTILAVFENASKAGVVDATSFHQGVAYNEPFNFSVQNLAVNDIDSDGKPEIVATVASYSGNILSIFRNETYPAPRIDALKNASGVTQSGAIGSTITTQGDFQFTNYAEPIVRFGLISGPITTASNASIIINVPPGAGNDKVSVTSHGLTGFSKLSFHPTFVTNGTLDATTFPGKVDYALSVAETQALAIADLDNDGRPDIAAGDGGNITLMQSVLSTAGADITGSSFTQTLPKINMSIGPNAISVTDIDGDGLLDISGSANAARNNSGTQSQAITFEAPVQALVGAYSNSRRQKANVDLNHDGKNDVVSATTNTIFVSENRSIRGSFTTGAPFSTFAPVISFTSTGILGEASAGDFDGDGFDDIVFLNTTTNQMGYMLNAGHNSEITTSSFGAIQYTSTDASPTYLFVDDYNADQKPDVAVIYSSIATVSIYTNTSTAGSISFLKQDIVSLDNAVGLSAADLDGDGKPDIVTIHGVNAGPFNFSILKNTSTGSSSFAPKLDYALDTQPSGLALGDLNLDGKADIVISRAGPLVSIFQNRLSSSNIIVISTQPTDITTCSGTGALLSVAASGTTNINYHWQFATAATGTFTDLSDGNGYTGSTTANLIINPTGNFGAGFYRARVNGDLAAQVISNVAHFVVTESPQAPTATGGTTCDGGTVTLSAAGGTDGNYRWYANSTNGVPIPGAVNSLYTTPGLTVTTNFYVSVTNGLCESESTQVTATVLPPPCSAEAPVIRTEPLSTTMGGTITIDLKPLITTSVALDINSIKVITQPTESGATAIISNGVLTINYSGNAFQGTESIIIEACDQSGLCTYQTFAITISVSDEITIYEGLSPNGDNLNDYFRILNIELLPDTKTNHVTIYNRWGDEVFSVSDYDNSDRAFNGVSKSGNKLPAGTYFYRIEIPGRSKIYRGFLSLKY